MAAMWRAIRIIRSITSWSRRNSFRHSGSDAKRPDPESRRIRVRCFASPRNDEAIVARMSEATSGTVSAAFLAMTHVRAELAMFPEEESEKKKTKAVSPGKPAAGQCLCGKVAFEIDVPARWAWHDHSPVKPSRAWRGVCNLCRKLAQALPHHQRQDQPHALRGQGDQDGAKLLRELRHAHCL